MKLPLAFLWRPTTINNIIGQEHIINNKNGIIRRMIKYNYASSLIFYGPPGIGKTSLALALANDLKIKYQIFNCALDKKSDIEKIITNAKNEEQYIIIVEEIHRMNKDRQDILLHSLENRNLIMFATTTENPFFIINPAIRSRSNLIALEKITPKQMMKGLKKIFLKVENPILNKIDDEALKLICHLASGDLRVAINILEIIINLYPDQKNITYQLVKTIIPSANLINAHYGDHHHDLKSALQKSIRGSDVDAAIYYLAQMLISGDYEALIRRLLIIAYEDIGLANPTIAMRLNIAINSFHQVGMPEGKIILSAIVTEMALSSKSNSTYLAINKAFHDLENGKVYQVPKHLRDSSYKSATKLGHGINYKYPHNFANAYVEQQYLPDELANTKYYVPKSTSHYEIKLNQIHQQFTTKKDK